MAIRRVAMATTLALVSACSNDAGACSDCTVVVERMAVLGQTDGDGALPGAVRSIIRDRDGRLLIGAWNAEQILIFDTTGRFVQGIGRRGEGPGEFGGTIYLLVRTRGDSIVAVDARGGRLSSFSPTWEPGWTAPDVAQFGGGSLEALPRGGFVRGAEVSPRVNPSGDPLHLLSADGKLARSFGADSTDPDSPGTRYPLLTATPNGHVWAADRHRYRLIQWSTDGRALQSIERRPEWFPPRTAGAAVTPEQAPVPAINAIHLDQANRLWVLIEVGASNWAEGLGDAEQGAHGVRYPIIDDELVYETVIEVLDATTGALLGSTRTPASIRLMVDDGLAARYFEDDVGVPRLELVRLSLR